MSEKSLPTTLSHVERDRAVAVFDRAKSALAEAKAIIDVMHVRDLGEQLELLARQAKDRDLIADAVELQQRSERKLGEILIEAKETGQLRPGRPTKAENASRAEGILSRATLADAGVTYKLSMKAQALAGVPADRFEEVLQAAREKIKSGGAVVVNPVKDLKTADKKVLRAIKEAQLAANQKALPDKKYGVILADPEWEFETWSDAGKDRSADNHYPTSSDAVIAARPVGDLAAEDCVLFLWTPTNRIDRALKVMEAWGFEYKALTGWDKVEVGTGYWFRDRLEILLVGVRGNVPAPAPGEQWENLVSSPKGAHSEKPEWAYELIEHYFPNLPKIELNARSRRDGWDAWGFEAPDDEESAAADGGEGGVVTDVDLAAEHIPQDEPGDRISGGPKTAADPSSFPAETDGGEPVAREDGGADPLLAAAGPIAVAPETHAGDGVVGAGEGEGTEQAPDALPDPSSPEGQEAIIRAGYAKSPPTSIAELMAATGLTRDQIKKRAQKWGIASEDNQRAAVRVLMERINDGRRAADVGAR